MCKRRTQIYTVIYNIDGSIDYMYILVCDIVQNYFAHFQNAKNNVIYVCKQDTFSEPNVQFTNRGQNENKK